MGFKFVGWFFIVLVACSDSRFEATNKVPHDGGLLIECGPPQGLRQTDSLGNSYGFTTVTSVITNERTFPIHIEMTLLNEYDYSTAYGNQKYKVILLPEELTPDTATLINPYNEKIGRFLEAGLYNTPYVLNKTLGPNEICVVTTGTLRPSCNTCGVIPDRLFTVSNGESFSYCDRPANEKESSNSQFDFELKINFSEGCKIIPFGKISYPK